MHAKKVCIRHLTYYANIAKIIFNTQYIMSEMQKQTQ